jgi:LPXTG-site transpeptidase (sortase) family protein
VRRRRPAVAALAALLVAQVVLAGLVLTSPGPPAAAPPAPAVALSAGRAPAAPPVTPPVTAPVTADPAAGPEVDALRLEIPDLGLDVPLGTTTTDAAGVLVPPEEPGDAEWFTGSARPGDPGPAVVVGHVASRRGPGVFRRLAELGPRDEVVVHRGGTVARFRVTSVRTVPKTEFPTQEVYGPVPGPELRLITCGGGFDSTTRHYLDNVVVSAVLVP